MGQMSGASTEMRNQSRWLVRCRPFSRDVGIRLFCFPFAGGGANAFRRWVTQLEGVDLVCVQLPGRERRFAEPPVSSVENIVHHVAQEICHYTDVPFAFLGYSMGAIVAFETAHFLATRGMVPFRLVVAAMSAPDLWQPLPIAELGDDLFLQTLQDRYEGVPEEVARDPELLKLLLPALRADMRAIEQYRYRERPVLNTKITALGGDDDRCVSRDSLAAWLAHARRGGSTRMYAGKHFFMWSQAKTILAELRVELFRDVGIASSL
jgi:surfactin synthase thioesterase subunit